MNTSNTARQMGLVSQILFILCSVLIIDTSPQRRRWAQA